MSQPKQEHLRKNQFSSLASFVMLVLVTLMVWEWLRPLMVLTDTYTIRPFILYFGLAMLIQWLNLSNWIRSGIMLFFLIYFVHNLYIYEPFFSSDWIRYLGSELLYSIGLLFNGDIDSHSYIVLTLFFLLIHWFGAIVIFKLVIERGKTLFFFLLTIVLLAILDTFTPYAAMFPIIRSFIYGLLLLTISQIGRLFPRLGDRAATATTSFPQQWLWTSVLVVGLVTAIGFVAPKAAPAWPDPIHFIQSYSDSIREGSGGFGGGAIQRIGYGTNDENLGGPFILDDGLVFVAQTQGRGYWRGESKDVYTGKGWVQSDTSAEQKALQMSDGRFYAQDLGLGLLHSSGSTLDSVTSRIRFDQPRFSTVFYTGEPTSIFMDPVEYPEFLEVNSQDASLKLFAAGEDEVGLHSYTVTSELPTYSTQALKNASVANSPSEILEQYTQLPDTLPDRVGELAQEIVQEADSDYERVKRVERFFKTNGFEYNIEDVAVPDDDQDYVDQFLFETMVGYCDNFSSSMVVLLRTLDIPARWVKGFTFGDVLEASGGEFTTEIRNRNAHSWVEVYFPEIGWVPFEPTQSFNNPFIFERDDIDTSNPEDFEMEYDPLDDPFSDSFEEGIEEYSSFTPGGASGSSGSWFSIGRILIALAAILILLLIIAFLFRKNLLLSWVIMRYKEASDQPTFFRIYEWLIRYLGKSTKPRDPSQTMREYVLALEQELEITELKSITQLFEQMRYGKNQDDEQVNRAFAMWRTIMNKLKS
ncbi:DUF4129 domain-containing transglutaminase family protein [Bacillus horti]|uniref:Transglutaminase-like putative cysteine protease n=1 Tax=Caldalkalibacillus horti TaxID=77523 RepID=A0ABT9W5B3_9BACI|nr:transglutaminase domain-containing protein [Bacillus horti]MDQ0168320.1 transglutaminase-like putative cysteine protease [Bacillus horti]